MERADDTFSLQRTRGYRLTIFKQLQQAVEAMHRPEEMFQWLTSVIVQRFDVPILQLWTCESSWTDRPSAQLRAMACQDSSPPAYVVSEKVAMTVERISREQRMLPPQPIEHLFPNYLASLLKRYGLSYCSFCLIDRNVRFAPVDYALSHERMSTGLTFIALIFLWRYPQQDFISTINIILEQAMVVAENHGLLLPVSPSSGHLPLPQEAPSQDPLPGLIPRKKQDAGLLLSSNPFASSPVIISDRQARRLYDAIDNHKTLSELCSTAGMSLKEGYTALQTLLNLQCIEIYTSQGWPVDVAPFFKNH
jgi:hypothetical protein